MSDEGLAFAFGLFLGACACAITWVNTSDNAETDAVRAGVAEFVLPEPDSRRTEFRWIVCECEPCSKRREALK